MNSFVVGVDIGGSHITAALIDLGKRQIQQESIYRQLVDSNGSLQEIITSWSAAIKECTKPLADGDIYIGIAMPGPFDYTKGICYIKEQNKFSALYEVNAKEALAEALNIDSCNIQFSNDAASFLKGEVFSGVAQNCPRVMGLTLGTGFGSALYINGEVVDANLWCSPFKNGIAEDYFSTRWFVRRYAEKTGRQIKNVKDLSALFHAEDAVKEIFIEFGENLASFVSEIVKHQNPEMVVFGGNIAACFPYFSPPLQNYLQDQKVTVTVKQSALNEYASLIGAASCWSKKVEIEPNF